MGKISDFTTGFLEGAKASATRGIQAGQSVGAGVSMDKKLLAAMCLPFTIVLAMGSAEVILQTVISLVPITAGSGIQFIQFLLGTILFIGAFAIQFLWVQSGGFGIFD